MILLKPRIWRQLDEGGQRLHAALHKLLRGDGHHARRAFVVGRAYARALQHLLHAGIRRLTARQEWPGVGSGAVHGADLAVALDIQLFSQLNEGFYEILAVGVRLEDVHKDEIIVALADAIPDDGVRQLDDALAPPTIEHRAVSSEIVERARPCEASNLSCVELFFKGAQGEGADVADVYPRLEDGENVRITQLGTGSWISNAPICM